jgi:hypothetical protein
MIDHPDSSSANRHLAKTASDIDGRNDGVGLRVNTGHRSSCRVVDPDRRIIRRHVIHIVA